MSFIAVNDYEITLDFKSETLLADGNDIVFLAVFSPKNYEMLFIINNGDIENSAIAYNSIEEEK